MKKAFWIKTDGTNVEVQPKDGKYFKYEELQGFTKDEHSSMVQIVPMPSGKLLVCNEEGKLNGADVNGEATEIWKKEYPIDKFPMNNDELIVGNVLITDEALLEK